MSRSAAINAKCKDCIFDPRSPGTWRDQTEACTSGPESRNPCALWPYRPISIDSVYADRAKRQADEALNKLVEGLEDDE